MITADDIHGSTTAADYLAGWQRARAELENFRRRIETERQAARGQLVEEVTVSLVTLADNFHALTNHVPPELAKHAWTEGVLHVARQMEQLLNELGVTTINAAGALFDPQQHEAIGKEPAKVPSGTVLEVVQPGYRIGQRVIRPARVKISA
jgi:molecular chaperone GrpE